GRWNSSQIHLRFDIHPRTKLAVLIFARFKNDFDGDALNDLYVVACGIFRGQKTEERASGARYAVDMTCVRAAAGVDLDVNFLSGGHVAELGLFEIGGNPDFIERNDGKELLARLDVEADDNSLVHFAADRGDDPRVLQIEFGLLEGGAFLLYVGNSG